MVGLEHGKGWRTAFWRSGAGSKDPLGSPRSGPPAGRALGPRRGHTGDPTTTAATPIRRGAFPRAEPPGWRPPGGCNHRKPLRQWAGEIQPSGPRSAAERLELADRPAVVAMPCACPSWPSGELPSRRLEEKEEAWTLARLGRKVMRSPAGEDRLGAWGRELEACLWNMATTTPRGGFFGYGARSSGGG